MQLLARTSRLVARLAGVMLALAAASCGGTVASEDDLAADAGSEPSVVTDAAREPDDSPCGRDACSDATTPCPGPPNLCVHGCGSDWVDQQVCSAGAWACPPDTIDPSTCPAGTCWGPPAPGEVCGPNGWECAPSATLLATCPTEALCATCPASPPAAPPACTCACDPQTQVFSCRPADRCCTVDFDCGDAIYDPCVNGKCIADPMPLPKGQCWKDLDCPSGDSCAGVSVCACNAVCDAPDAPGACVGPK